MNLTALCFSYAGWAALALAMERHWSDRFGRSAEPGRWRVPLQFGGSVLLLAAWALCWAREGGGYGTIAWLGSLTLAGVALVVTFTYRPQIATVAAPALLVVGLIAAR